jgi:hypothetical protein
LPVGVGARVVTGYLGGSDAADPKKPASPKA